jgi:hypothetical protein
MNPTEKNQPQDEEVLKKQEKTEEAALDEETQKEAAEELSAEEKVNKDLADAQKTIEEQHDKYLRLSAEFDNYRKRTMKEKAELIKNGGEKTISAILPILDDLERALNISETSDDVKAMREGIELIYNKFLKVLNQGNWCNPSLPIYNIGLVIYIVLVVFFAYFYTSITFNPLEVSNNIKKQGGFIPGIRPGKPTTDYLTGILNYIIFIGAVGLIIIAVIPFFFNGVFGANVSFGGTSLIIIVSVILETIKQIESLMLVRNYKGFLNA